MGYLRRPSYFKDFHCISSKCTDSCCWHWEIDIDDDTLRYYNQVPGDFGRRLRESILPPNEKTGEPAHFIQDKRERCPFLNSCNLCDIFLQLGEEHLSCICTHHPRYYDWLVDGQEAGLGLCCEEAARLILQKTGYPTFELIEETGDGDTVHDGSASSPKACQDTPPDEDLQLEQIIEHRLLAMREELFAVIKPEDAPHTGACRHTGRTQPFPAADSRAAFDARLDALFLAALRMQEECDRWFFPEEAPSGGESAFSWSAAFWQEDCLTELLDYYLKLEINDPSWWKLLHQLKGRLPVLLSCRSEFLSFYQDRLYEYEQLLIYFLFRHFLKAREDLLLTEKVAFALISVCMIQLLDMEHWLTSGSLTLRQQIDICKLYSKEIEYDEDNTEQVSLFRLPDLRNRQADRQSPPPSDTD